MMELAKQRSFPAALGLAWALVILPTLWGLTYTVENALKLFRNTAPAITAPGSQK